MFALLNIRTNSFAQTKKRSSEEKGSNAGITFRHHFLFLRWAFTLRAYSNHFQRTINSKDYAFDRFRNKKLTRICHQSGQSRLSLCRFHRVHDAGSVCAKANRILHCCDVLRHSLCQINAQMLLQTICHLANIKHIK